MEIERKFIPERLPEKLEQYPSKHMIQGYLNVKPVVRVRREGDAFMLTVKGPGGLSHEEHELPLTEEAFLHLLGKCDGRLIEKTRYLLPVEGHPELTAELDVFEGSFSGFVMLEVEFPSVEEALSFTPPEWYGQDVTDVPECRNAAMALGADPRTLFPKAAAGAGKKERENAGR